MQREGLTVRMGELSRRTGVPIPTIKYYLRLGLLPPGVPSCANQADYEAAHEHRLRLVRALTEQGRVSIAQVHTILDAMATPGVTLCTILRAIHIQGSGTQHEVAGWDADRERATRVVEGLFSRQGWRPVEADHPEVRKLTEAIVTAHRLGHPELVDALDTYADAGARIARADLRYAAQGRGQHDVVERAVVATFVGEAILSALRRLAQEGVCTVNQRSDAAPW
jgi:DNA-binding transcriptional MerR regulator